MTDLTLKHPKDALDLLERLGDPVPIEVQFWGPGPRLLVEGDGVRGYALKDEGLRQAEILSAAAEFNADPGGSWVDMLERSLAPYLHGLAMEATESLVKADSNEAKIRDVAARMAVLDARLTEGLEEPVQPLIWAMPGQHVKAREQMALFQIPEHHEWTMVTGHGAPYWVLTDTLDDSEDGQAWSDYPNHPLYRQFALLVEMRPRDAWHVHRRLERLIRNAEYPRLTVGVTNVQDVIDGVSPTYALLDPDTGDSQAVTVVDLAERHTDVDDVEIDPASPYLCPPYGSADFRPFAILSAGQPVRLPEGWDIH